MAISMVLTTPADAARTKSSFMPVGEAVEPPYGYFDFCHRLQADCSEFLGEAAPAELDDRAVNSDYWDLVFQPPGATSTSLNALSSSWIVADLSPEMWREVAAINRRVNGEIASASDQKQFGRRDFWALPGAWGHRSEGDCEDYVLQKRAQLIEAGVPEGALSIAIAKTRRWEVHAVLLIATPSGEYVLDNRSAWVSRWYDLNYSWERRQVPGSKAWVRVRA